jgi:hypothetical protein
LERDFGALAALSAGRGEHLTRGSVTGALATFYLPCLAALGTALGLVGIALGLKELLVVGTEGECIAAVSTLKGLVLKTHLDDLLSYKSARVRVIQS